MKIKVCYYIFFTQLSFCFPWSLTYLLPSLATFLLVEDNIYYQVWGGATHEVSLMHEKCWARLLWIFSMLTKLQQHVWQSAELCAWALWKVVETPSNLASGKAPLRQINIIISLAWMMKVRHRDSDKPSCRQPCGRVCPGFSHDVSTAEGRVIMEFPSSHLQNKVLLFFQTQWGYMGASTMRLWSLYLQCSCTTLSNAETFNSLLPWDLENGELQSN